MRSHGQPSTHLFGLRDVFVAVYPPPPRPHRGLWHPARPRPQIIPLVAGVSELFCIDLSMHLNESDHPETSDGVCAAPAFNPARLQLTTSLTPTRLRGLIKLASESYPSPTPSPPSKASGKDLPSAPAVTAAVDDGDSEMQQASQ